MSTINYVTKESLEQMRDELTQLKTAGRAEIANAIAEAREKGDLRENAEYDAAKEAQGLHEAKVAQLENIIANARIIDIKDIDTSKVSVLSKVKITNLKTKKTIEYQIVSEKEADLKAGKISVGSPIAQGLLGKSVGDTAEVTAPAGSMKFKNRINQYIIFSISVMSIFTKIIAGEIPSYKIAEDEHFFAFLDIFPLVKGHVLIVPKVEVDKIFDVDDAYLAKWLVFAKPIAKAIEKAFDCKRCGMTVIGLEVPHAHMHLLPINHVDDMNFAKAKLKLSETEHEEIQRRILSAMH